jgi:hypothetical protein
MKALFSKRWYLKTLKNAHRSYENVRFDFYQCQLVDRIRLPKTENKIVLLFEELFIWQPLQFKPEAQRKIKSPR